MKLNEVLDFIKQHNLAVVSTVDRDNSPQSAVVEFAEKNDLTIIIDTLKSSRKYKNLQNNKNVSIVIGWDNDKTVQINAFASELGGEDLKAAQTVYFQKNKRAKNWACRPDIAYFSFKPTWVRYSDVSIHPWVIQEFELSKQ